MKNTKNWSTIDALGAIFAIFTTLDTWLVDTIDIVGNADIVDTVDIVDTDDIVDTVDIGTSF